MFILFKNFNLTAADGSKLIAEPSPSLLNTSFYLKSCQSDQQTPISFEHAMDLVFTHFHHLIMSDKTDEAIQLMTTDNVLMFLTKQGFHIEWTGDEFVVLDQKLAC